MAEMLRKAIQNPTRTYNTPIIAEKALTKVLKKLGLEEMPLRYLISVHTVDDAIRFYPVLLPTEVQLNMAFTIAQAGVAVVRT